MRVEIPELKRCCFCLPLRRGLIFWIYLKLVVAVLLLLYTLCILFTAVPRFEILFFISLITATIVSVIEIAFCIVFLVSAHKKDHVYLRVYYRYAMALLIFEVVFLLGLVGFEIFITTRIGPFVLFIAHDMIACVCITFWMIVLQAYFVVLVRSEVVKLQKGTNFEFINHTSEPECKAQLTV